MLWIGSRPTSYFQNKYPFFISGRYFVANCSGICLSNTFHIKKYHQQKLLLLAFDTPLKLLFIFEKFFFLLQNRAAKKWFFSFTLAWMQIRSFFLLFLFRIFLNYGLFGREKEVHIASQTQSGYVELQIIPPIKTKLS